MRWLGIYAVLTFLVARISFFPEMRISHGVLMYLLLRTKKPRASRASIAP